MKVFVINLERSVKRRKAISKQLERFSFEYEIVNAVDGSSFSEDDIKSLCHPILIEHSVNRGQVACSLSHIEIYKKIVSEGHCTAVVLEDDVVLSDSFSEIINDLESKIREDEVILLHAQASYPLKVALKNETELTIGYKLHYLIPHFGCIGSAAAYMVTKKVAERLVGGLVPLFTHADGWGPFMKKGLIEFVRCVFPYPVSPAFFGSDIPYLALDTFQGKLKIIADKTPGINKLMLLRRKKEWKKSQKNIYFVNENPVPASILFKHKPV